MATTKTRTSPSAAGTAVKAYAEKAAAEVLEGKAKLELLEAKAKAGKAVTEIAAIKGLASARENISRKLQDLKTTHTSNVPRAKADIAAEVLLFKAAIDAIAGRLDSSKNDAAKNDAAKKKEGEKS